MEKLRGRYRLHRFAPRHAAPFADTPLPGVSAVEFQRQLMDGFQQGMQKGFEQGLAEGHEQGREEGRQKGQDDGYRDGYAEGSLAGQKAGLTQFTEAAAPLEAIASQLNDFMAHAQR